MIITSVNNEKIKEIKKLKQNKYILKEKKFIIEGEHLVLEAKKNNILLETISLTDEDYGVKNTTVSKNVMDSISMLSKSSNIIGICKTFEEDKSFGKRILILDNVQDPGNLGTIIRSSNAFNFGTVVLSNNSVSKYNSKVLRATQGMIFKVNVITRNLKEFIPHLINKGYKIYGTDVANGKDVSCVDKENNIAVIMGSEGKGISDDVKEFLRENIYIKMNDNCESLNVSVAASIIMYEINKEV